MANASPAPNASANCLYVSGDDDRQSVSREIRKIELPTLRQDFARIRVEYSSLNYKDALCASGHPGVAKTLPIVPGIDAAGTVIECAGDQFSAGDQVMVFQASFGTERNGGWCELVDVPVEWIYHLPPTLSPRQAMTLGTAGFTAAHCVDQLQRHAIKPAGGPVIVTGATGGVGICAVKLLAQLGYEVTAVTGKPDKAGWLKSLGAKEVIGRDEAIDSSDRPLLKARWAGAVDTVGGATLATILRNTKPYGCVTACGLVGGVELHLSVYPFILRGITLQGIDSAGLPREIRQALWQRMSADLAIDGLDELAIEVDLHGLEPKIQAILAGEIAGRVIVKL